MNVYTIMWALRPVILIVLLVCMISCISVSSQFPNKIKEETGIDAIEVDNPGSGSEIQPKIKTEADIMKELDEENETAAIGIYLSLLKTDPDNDLILNNLGISYKHTGDYEKAFLAFKNAILANSSCKEAWNNLGDLYCTTNQYEKAVYVYKEAIKIDESYAGAYNGICFALKNLGKPGDALDACTRAVTLDPAYGTAWKNRADTEVDLMRYSDALESYETATRYIPKNSLLWNNRGYLLAVTGDISGAISSYEQALVCDPTCKPAVRALIYLRSMASNTALNMI